MTAADNLAITARAGKAVTFLTNGSTEFFPGAGSTLHFANRDTDTFTARNIPAGLLQAGDSVTVKYGNTVVFKGDVDRIVDRHGRGDDRVQDVTVAGPWGKLNRLVFKQTWGAGAVAFSSSRVILGQTAAGLAQTMAAQLAEIAGFAATPCGIALGTNAAPAQYLPLDEARDITCADAIRRELRFFPKLVVRFDYAQSTPTLEIVALSTTDASYVAAPAMRLSKGQISDFISTAMPGHGLVVYLENRVPGDAAEAQMVRSQIRDELSQATSYAFTSAWNGWNLSRMNLKAGSAASIEEYADDGEVPEE